ncbi:class I SAM-dependent methyltransferase [Roseateles sp.]|uniref:class I SAM-dependent methyltransferase n=1 Tax=Roseateles sp. TaxID=1971397 RepID=UPI0039E92D6E
MTALLRRMWVSATRLGPRRSAQTLLSMAEDALFDLRLGTDTTAAVAQSRLKVLSPDKQADAKPYVMTRARALRHAFKRCPAPRDLRFNDIGCGKGKVVITAALEGFRNVRGLDFAPELVEAAERNLALVRERLPAGSQVSVQCADVTQAEFGPSDCVFFLYNPFAADVMRGFSEHLARSLQLHPRKIWVIYADPAFLSTMLAHLPVRETGRSAYGGFTFVQLETN